MVIFATALAALSGLVVFFIIVASLFSGVGLISAIKFLFVDWEKLMIYMMIIIGVVAVSKIFLGRKK